jgi:tRNA-binding protein
MYNNFLFLVTLVGHMLSIDTSAAQISHVIVKTQRESILDLVPKSVFSKLRLNIGRTTSVVPNNKARIPAYIIKLDFEKPHLKHLTQSSAQLVDRYDVVDGLDKKGLYDQQLVAATNFPKRNIGVPSFFLVLGVVGISEEEGGTVVLVPSKPVSNGARLVLLNNDEIVDYDDEQKMPLVDFSDTFERLDFRVGTVIDDQNGMVDFGELGLFTLRLNDYGLKNNMQIIRLFNLIEDDNKLDNILGVFENYIKVPITVEAKVPNGRFVL